MRLAIDASCWSNRRGFGRFTRELVGQIVRRRGEHEVTLVTDRLTAAAGELPEGARLVVVDTREQPSRAAAAGRRRSLPDVWRMSLAASRQPADVFFFPAVYSFYPLLRRVPTVLTFHDAIAEGFPGLVFERGPTRLFWRFKTLLARSQASRVLTVSEDARVRVARTLRWPVSRIDVVAEAAGEGFAPLDDPQRVSAVLRRYAVPPDRPIVLYVGGISPHKNLVGLVRAMARLDAAGRTDWHLVLVGDHSQDSFLGCFAEVGAVCRDEGLLRQVTFTGYVPDSDLVSLYNAATLLVLPSFDEGFGLPAAEAMACGLPAAVSRRGSLPEVLGEAAAYFDPEDHGQMASVIARVLGDAGLRRHMREAGLQRARQLSWEAAADKTLAIFAELAHGG
jgi:glycosyltransferase involved in cell wall biosynthesis